MNHCAPWPRGLEGKKLGKPKEETEKKSVVITLLPSPEPRRGESRLTDTRPLFPTVCSLNGDVPRNEGFYGQVTLKKRRFQQGFPGKSFQNL